MTIADVFVFSYHHSSVRAYTAGKTTYQKGGRMMRRNRLLLCFLLGIAIIFYGVPYLTFQGDTMTVLFSTSWLLFALIAISGNMIGLLYGKRVDRTSGTISKKISTQTKQKVRQYS